MAAILKLIYCYNTTTLILVQRLVQRKNIFKKTSKAITHCQTSSHGPAIIPYHENNNNLQVWNMLLCTVFICCPFIDCLSRLPKKLSNLIRFGKKNILSMALSLLTSLLSEGLQLSLKANLVLTGVLCKATVHSFFLNVSTTLLSNMFKLGSLKVVWVHYAVCYITS